MGQEVVDAGLRKARLDSLVRPEALSASPWRRPITLSDDFPQRAERFFAGAFGRMNDGVLMLVGNFDENALKRILAQYLGGFKTGRAGTARFRSAGRAPAGHPVRVDEGAVRPQIDLELTASLDFTVEHFVAAHIAARVLSDAVAATYARRGWYSEADWRFDLFPSDCFTLTMLASLADADGMPASVMPVGSADEVMSEVKETIRQTAAQGISEQRLKACKTELVNQYESWAGDPQTILDMLVLRYSYSKDLMSKYSENVAAVTRDQVDRVLQLLASGASAEWMTRAAQPDEPLHASVPEEPAWPEVVKPLPPTDSTGILDVWRELFGEPSFPIPSLPVKQTHE
ncbi:MAG: insulinase family protein [Bacteroidales bacterium]|nr:insulinase family protein [Bacteroidales bacterium]